MITEPTFRKASRIALGALALALVTAACGDDGKPAADASEGGPAVLLVERVFSPQGARSYFVSILPDMPTAAVDRMQAKELVSADPEFFNDRLYIRDRDANTITRYKISVDRKLEEDGVVSFAGTGLGANRYPNAYVSPTKAYVLDSTAWRMIGWNPTEMTLTGEIISIEAMAKRPLPTGQISPAVRAGDRLIASVTWADLTTTHLVTYPGSGALIIDASGTPSFIEDPRVGGGFRISADANGDAFLTGTVGGDMHMFGTVLDDKPFPTSGVLRIPAGQNAFDPSYLIDVEAITGSKGIWAIHRIDATTLLVQVLDPGVTAPATAAAYAASQDFEYGVISTAGATPTFTPLTTPPKSGRGNAGNHILDGRLYIQISDSTGSSVFSVSSGQTTPAPAFTVPSGDLWYLQRVR